MACMTSIALSKQLNLGAHSLESLADAERKVLGWDTRWSQNRRCTIPLAKSKLDSGCPWEGAAGRGILC